MPECVEVMLMARATKSKIANKLVTGLKLIGTTKKKMPDEYDIFVNELPMYCVNVETNGKLLWFEFAKNIGDKDKWYIFNNLGLYGGWNIDKKDCCIELEYKSDHIITKGSSLQSLFFKDSVYSLFRIFNLKTQKSEIDKVLKSRGIDVCKQNITTKDLDMQLKRIKKPVEVLQFLMKQDYLSGIGNFYKAEILYDAGLSPHRLTSLLLKEDKERLCTSINKVIGDAINNNGRLLKYSDLMGTNINQYEGNIYQKQNDDKGNKVICENTSDGRKTYWVVEVQK